MLTRHNYITRHISRGRAGEENSDDNKATGKMAKILTADSLPASFPLPPVSCTDARAGRVPRKACGEGRGAARRRGWECEMP